MNDNEKQLRTKVKRQQGFIQELNKKNKVATRELIVLRKELNKRKVLIDGLTSGQIGHSIIMKLEETKNYVKEVFSKKMEFPEMTEQDIAGGKRE